VSYTHPLSKEVGISIGATTTAGAAGSTAINGTAVDMAGFEACLAIVPLGTIVGTAVTSIKAQVADDSGFTVNVEDVATSNQSIADTEDDKVYYFDVTRPTRRWLRIVVSRGTANATIGGIIYLRYRGRELPVTHGSNIVGEVVGEGISGTA